VKFPPLPLLILDTETTGFVPGIHRVIEYACMTADGGKITSEYEQLLSLDGDEIPRYVQVMTHIRPEDVAGKPTFGDIFERIEKMLVPGMIVVGQNIKYDISMLKGEGWDLSDFPSIDTAMLASLVFPELKSYSLSYVSVALKLDHTPKHRALGDVRATVALLGKCWERIISLPAADLQGLADLANRGPEGYRRFFEAAAAASGKVRTRPKWLTMPDKQMPSGGTAVPLKIIPPPRGTVQLCEESLSPQFLTSVLSGAQGQTWVAVKNIDATLRRLPATAGFSQLPSPETLLSSSAAKALLAQPAFTADELTVALKLHLYRPTLKSEFPIHGDEHQVWNAKLACTNESSEYLERLASARGTSVLINHHHFFALAQTKPEMLDAAHVIIDDASMLEDTATQALGWTCLIPTLRAAAQGNETLTKCADLVELWVEKTRAGLDLKYLSAADLETQEAAHVRTLIENIAAGQLPTPARRALTDLSLILDTKNLEKRIAWIESFVDGSKCVKSAPEDVAVILDALLYECCATTLIIPQGSAEYLAPILPSSRAVSVLPVSFPSPRISLAITARSAHDAVKSSEGKQVVLMSSKRTIEDVYIQHAESSEAAGINLFCQGFSGGQSRMQAEFALAEDLAVLVSTPWMYETMELPAETISRLVLQVLPFDHPSHAVFSKRAQRYRNSFNDYSVPRLRNRLFRLIRTFCKHSADGVFEILDERLRIKPYGKEILKYLQELIPAGGGAPAKEGQIALL
jgi:DNA polymerase III epsilon subunit-like protein